MAQMTMIQALRSAMDVMLARNPDVVVFGERLHVIPNHVCVAMNMHDEVWVHRGGEVVDRWAIAARGKVR